MAKTKKQIKKEQASVQSDQLEMGFSEGVTYGGSFELENGMSDMTYSFGELGEINLSLLTSNILRSVYTLLSPVSAIITNSCDRFPPIGPVSAAMGIAVNDNLLNVLR